MGKIYSLKIFEILLEKFPMTLGALNQSHRLANILISLVVLFSNLSSLSLKESSDPEDCSPQLTKYCEKLDRAHFTTLTMIKSCPSTFQIGLVPPSKRWISHFFYYHHLSMQFYYYSPALNVWTYYHYHSWHKKVYPKSPHYMATLIPYRWLVIKILLTKLPTSTITTVIVCDSCK